MKEIPPTDPGPAPAEGRDDLGLPGAERGRPAPRADSKAQPGAPGGRTDAGQGAVVDRDLEPDVELPEDERRRIRTGGSR